MKKYQFFTQVNLSSGSMVTRISKKLNSYEFVDLRLLELAPLHPQCSLQSLCSLKHELMVEVGHT